MSSFLPDDTPRKIADYLAKNRVCLPHDVTFERWAGVLEHYDRVKKWRWQSGLCFYAAAHLRESAHCTIIYVVWNRLYNAGIVPREADQTQGYTRARSAWAAALAAGIRLYIKENF